MNVREATPDDADAVRAVHRESITGLGPDAYDDEQVEAWARGTEDADYEAAIAGDGHFVVAEDGDEVLAFGSLSLSEPDDYEADVDAEVTGVYVRPEVARQGVGSAVLADLEQRARTAGAETLGLTATLNALAFYEAHGYERVREFSHEFSAHLSTGVEGTVVEMRTAL